MLEISSLVPLPRHYLVGRISKLKILIAASFHSKRSDAKQLAASRHSFVPRISPAPVCRTSPQWYEVQPPQLRTSQTSFEPYPLEILDPLKRSASWKQLTRGEPGDPCWLSARTRGRWEAWAPPPGLPEASASEAVRGDKAPLPDGFSVLCGERGRGPSRVAC